MWRTEGALDLFLLIHCLLCFIRIAFARNFWRVGPRWQITGHYTHTPTRTQWCDVRGRDDVELLSVPPGRALSVTAGMPLKRAEKIRGNHLSSKFQRHAKPSVRKAAATPHPIAADGKHKEEDLASSTHAKHPDDDGLVDATAPPARKVLWSRVPAPPVPDTTAALRTPPAFPSRPLPAARHPPPAAPPLPLKPNPLSSTKRHSVVAPATRNSRDSKVVSARATKIHRQKGGSTNGFSYTHLLPKPLQSSLTVGGQRGNLLVQMSVSFRVEESDDIPKGDQGDAVISSARSRTRREDVIDFRDRISFSKAPIRRSGARRRSKGNPPSVSQPPASSPLASSSLSPEAAKLFCNFSFSGKHGSGLLGFDAHDQRTPAQDFYVVGLALLFANRLLLVVRQRRARVEFTTTTGPRATYVIQCWWRRLRQLRRVRELEAVRFLVPWIRLKLYRWRNALGASALQLQRVFRGQRDRTFVHFMHHQMRYNLALDVVRKYVMRSEAQIHLKRMRLQRDERNVLLGQCLQASMRLVREERAAYLEIVVKASAVLSVNTVLPRGCWEDAVELQTGYRPVVVEDVCDTQPPPSTSPGASVRREEASSAAAPSGEQLSSAAVLRFGGHLAGSDRCLGLEDNVMRLLSVELQGTSMSVQAPPASMVNRLYSDSQSYASSRKIEMCSALSVDLPQADTYVWQQSPTVFRFHIPPPPVVLAAHMVGHPKHLRHRQSHPLALDLSSPDGSLVTSAIHAQSFLHALFRQEDTSYLDGVEDVIGVVGSRDPAQLSLRPEGSGAHAQRTDVDTPVLRAHCAAEPPRGLLSSWPSAASTGTDREGDEAALKDPIFTAYIDLLVRTESVERKGLERELLEKHGNYIRPVRVVSQAIRLSAEVPPLFAPLLLTMRIPSFVKPAVRLFQAESQRRLDLIASYDAIPLQYLNRPRFFVAAEARRRAISAVVQHTASPLPAAEANEKLFFTKVMDALKQYTLQEEGCRGIVSPDLVPLAPAAARQESTATSTEVSAVVMHRRRRRFRVAMFPQRGTSGVEALHRPEAGSLLSDATLPMEKSEGDGRNRLLTQDGDIITDVRVAMRHHHGPPIPLLRGLDPHISAAARGRSSTPKMVSAAVTNSSPPTQSLLEKFTGDHERYVHVTSTIGIPDRHRTQQQQPSSSAIQTHVNFETTPTHLSGGAPTEVTRGTTPLPQVRMRGNSISSSGVEGVSDRFSPLVPSQGCSTTAMYEQPVPCDADQQLPEWSRQTWPGAAVFLESERREVSATRPLPRLQTTLLASHKLSRIPPTPPPRCRTVPADLSPDSEENVACMRLPDILET